MALRIFNTFHDNQSANVTSEDIHAFSASREWLIRFKTRFLLRNIRVQEEAASTENVAAQIFPATLKEIIKTSPK